MLDVSGISAVLRGTVALDATTNNVTVTSTLVLAANASAVNDLQVFTQPTRTVVVNPDGTAGSAPTPSGATFIQNQTATVQMAGFNISGSGGVGGNLGIGTTTPGEKLDVGGNANVSGTVKADGTVQVPAASAYTYATAKAYTITYGPDDFESATADAINGKLVTTGNGYESIYASGANGSLRAPLHLPQGAVVTSLVLYYLDYSNAGSFGVSLALVATSTPYGSTQILASFSSTGRPGNAPPTTIPVGSTIDNTAKAYSLRAAFGSSGGGAAIYGVKVNYTVTQAE